MRAKKGAKSRGGSGPPLGSEGRGLDHPPFSIANIWEPKKIRRCGPKGEKISAAPKILPPRCQEGGGVPDHSPLPPGGGGFSDHPFPHSLKALPSRKGRSIDFWILNGKGKTPCENVYENSAGST